MTNGGESTFFTAATASEGARGAGGKMKRQSTRKAPATPYSRPQQNLEQRKPWISRIVDPAYRIISDGATKILPYFFKNAASAAALTAPTDNQDQQDNSQGDSQENNTITPPNLNIPKPASIEEGGTSSTANVNESNFNISAHTRGKTALNDDVATSEVERLMKGKIYSQAATDRLIEIMNSRAIDRNDVKSDEKDMEMPFREGAKKNTSFFDNRNGHIDGKDTNSALWATPTPLSKSIIQDEAGLSPAELAKAYMEGQISASSSQGFVARNQNDISGGGMLVGNSSFESPSSKPSAFRPGIKLSEQSGFATPLSQRQGFGLQSLPRTPYSRTIFPNSKPKVQLQNDSSQRLINFQSPSQSVQTRYGQLKRSGGKDGGLFGPNKRSRQSATPSTPYSRPFSGKSRFENSGTMKRSEAGESSKLSMSQTTTYGKHKGSEVGTPTVPTHSAIMKSFEAAEASKLSMSQTTTYGKQKGSEVRTPTVSTHSSQIARTILEHLGRTQVTPKSKSEELKRATSWRHQQSSKPVEQSSLTVNNVKDDGSVKSNEDIQNMLSHYPSSAVLKPPANTTGDIQQGVIKTASASNGIFQGTHAASSIETALQSELGKPKVSLSLSTHEAQMVTPFQDAAKASPSGGEPANIPKPPFQPLGNKKPILPSISIAKPSQRWAIPLSSNTSSFTFPVSSSDGAASSEPSTPSIMPFTTNPAPSGGVAITSHHEATKDNEIPQFGFDGKRGGDKSRLVFTFPFVSEEVTDEDDARLGIKFTFGSEKQERISFSSAGSDHGVCC